MKTKFFYLSLCAALSITGPSMAFAHEDVADGATSDSAANAQSASPTPEQRAPYGYATSGTPERGVHLRPGTNYLNVTRLETVRIDIGGNSVVWTFDTLGTQSFPLSNIVPEATDVTVYVEESPLYRGG